ncbi:MAG TPA: hypothetical protein ENF70_01110 [Deltaproteobacteria bacterium]|nr:hypothetical protein [Deltaproteobacteria bacterium]
MPIRCAYPRKAIEIERSSTLAGLEKAAKRLKDGGKPQKVLQLPQKDMAKAAKAMQNVGVGATIKNMGGVPKDVLLGKRKN